MKYSNCMKFLVYKVIGEGITDKPMHVLKAQFEEKADAFMFRDKKQSSYIVMDNETGEIINS